MYRAEGLRALKGVWSIPRAGRSGFCLRNLHQTRVQNNNSDPLPATDEMKNEKWQIEMTRTEGFGKGNVTSQVIGMTNMLQDQQKQQPPLEVDDLYTKKFKLFDSYDPFDFSINQLDHDLRLKRSAQTNPRSKDPFERSGINPLHLYTMPFILSRFLTSTGQILSRDITGCNSKNQKRLAIAVKRARACGVLSSVHKDTSFLPSRIL